MRTHHWPYLISTHSACSAFRVDGLVAWMGGCDCLFDGEGGGGRGGVGHTSCMSFAKDVSSPACESITASAKSLHSFCATLQASSICFPAEMCMYVYVCVCVCVCVCVNV